MKATAMGFGQILSAAEDIARHGDPSPMLLLLVALLFLGYVAVKKSG